MNMKTGDRVGLVIDGLICGMQGVIVNDFGSHAYVHWPEFSDYSIHNKKSLYPIEESKEEN